VSCAGREPVSAVALVVAGDSEPGLLRLIQVLQLMQVCEALCDGANSARWLIECSGLEAE
jgi:hypothetical protein